MDDPLSAVSRCPPELWCKIISFVYKNRSFLNTAALSLVSKSFKELSEPIRMQTIHLSLPVTSRDRLDQFLMALQGGTRPTTTNNYRSVQNLFLHLHNPSDPTTRFHSDGFAEGFEDGVVDMLNLLSPALTKLAIFLGPNTSLPRLRHPHTTGFYASINPNPRTNVNLAHLQDLSFHISVANPASQTHPYMPIFPSLRRLTLSYGDTIQEEFLANAILYDIFEFAPLLVRLRLIARKGSLPQPDVLAKVLGLEDPSEDVGSTDRVRDDELVLPETLEELYLGWIDSEPQWFLGLAITDPVSADGWTFEDLLNPESHGTGKIKVVVEHLRHLRNSRGAPFSLKQALNEFLGE
ncbi:hypothetical protein JAAARDRAFT_81305 [Jaapia argillacea MUCL 33604]|uniref:Uncharacterized protein n=1 Tax=Jaapia argillacea MUCL 33604 TaxID=933084 RepID=A0A067PAE1_9AGAM|nr:hypothetical protein JAAARDRAFT_81305 [Jaapia argillacea MUCL 33604]